MRNPPYFDGMTMTPKKVAAIKGARALALMRLGRHDEALRVLRQAYGNRPHVEVAAHLGEALWANGQRDEALRVWRDGAARERDNDVLQETLSRLKVGL